MSSIQRASTELPALAPPQEALSGPQGADAGPSSTPTPPESPGEPQAGAQSLTRRRGICPVCAREFDVRVDGLIRHHLKPRPSHAWYRHPRCTGTEQPALPDTPAGDDHA